MRKKPIVLIAVFTLLAALLSAGVVFFAEWNVSYDAHYTKAALYENSLFFDKTVFTGTPGEASDAYASRVRQKVEDLANALQRSWNSDGRMDIYIVLKDADGAALYEYSSTDPSRRGGEKRIDALRARADLLFSRAAQPFDGRFDENYLIWLKTHTDGIPIQFREMQEYTANSKDKGYGYGALTVKRVSRVMVRASEETAGGGAVALFAICSYDTAAYILRDGAALFTMCAVAAVCIAVGAAIAVFTVREQKKRLRLEKIRRETLTVAQRRLEPTIEKIGEICRTCINDRTASGSAPAAASAEDGTPAEETIINRVSAGKTADTQRLYECILKLNGDVCEPLEKARKF